MPGQDKSSKTEQPTSKRLRDTKQKGQVARSIEFTSSLVFLCSILFFYFYLPLLLSDTLDIARHLLVHSDSSLVVKDYIDTYFRFSITTYLKSLLPFFAFALLFSLFVNYVQGGFIFSVTPLELKFSKLNPVTGFSRILLSKRTLVELLKNIIKISIVSYVGYKMIKDFIPDIILLVDQTPWQIIIYFGKAAFALCFKIGILLLVMSILDYMYQRYEFKSNLKMSKTEVKDELKEQEGNPRIKSKRMGMMVEVFRRRMMAEVPKSDVVITNPTFLAVAIRYDMEKAAAPVVVAKGARLVAEKIKEIAKNHDVPIIENKLLARLLYTSVEIGHQIPEQFYKAVAEILAYIYKPKNKKVI
ncbi:flagellar biosynthesis protein FlhB [bacterium]|nr:flagellar biosynthesis protein FlhB [bacterium]